MWTDRSVSFGPFILLLRASAASRAARAKLTNPEPVLGSPLSGGRTDWRPSLSPGSLDDLTRPVSLVSATERHFEYQIKRRYLCYPATHAATNKLHNGETGLDLNAALSWPRGCICAAH